MSIVGRIRDALSEDTTEDAEAPVVEGPAAASGVSGSTGPRSGSAGEVSSAGSGAGDLETAVGGADAVPDTPDGVSENYT